MAVARVFNSQEKARGPACSSPLPLTLFLPLPLTPTPDTSVLILKRGITSGSPSSSPRRPLVLGIVNAASSHVLVLTALCRWGIPRSSESPQPAAGPPPALLSLAPRCLSEALVPLLWPRLRRQQDRLGGHISCFPLSGITLWQRAGAGEGKAFLFFHGIGRVWGRSSHLP